MCVCMHTCAHLRVFLCLTSFVSLCMFALEVTCGCVCGQICQSVFMTTHACICDTIESVCVFV